MLDLRQQTMCLDSQKAIFMGVFEQCIVFFQEALPPISGKI